MSQLARVLVAMVPLCAWAGDAPPAAEPAPQIAIWLDHDLAAPGGKAARPLSMWSDPAAAGALSHIAKQIGLISGERIPADADLLGGWKTLSLAIRAAVPADPDPQRAPFALLLRHPLAANLRDALVAATVNPQPDKVGAYDGKGNIAFFAGVSGDLLACGDPRLLMAPPAAPPAEAKRSALWLTCDFGPTLAIVKQLEPDGISYGLDPLLPKWRDEAPQLTVGASPAGDVWESTLTLKASRLPFHAIDPGLAALGRSGKHARLAAGLEPRAVAGLIANLIDERSERELTSRLGMPLADAAATFTGDVLVLVDASGIIPQGCVALRLADGHDAKPLCAGVAAVWQGQEVQVPGADAAWALDTPLGPWGLALGKKLLVLGNDPDLAQQLLGDAKGDAPFPAGKAVVVDVDLPLLAKQWLPLAWKMLGDASYGLGDDPMLALQFRLPDAGTALAQSFGKDAKLSQLLQDPPPQLTMQRGEARMVWTPSPQLIAELKAVVGGTDAAAIDQAFAFYAEASDGKAPVAVNATVMRLADGFHVVEDDRRGKRAALTAAQLAQRLGDAKRVLGPDPAQLRPLAPPERPSIDRRWLPDPAVIQRHLPPYHLEVEMTTDGAQAHERGVPLGAGAAALAVTYLGLFQQPRMLQYHLRASGGQPGQPQPQPPPTKPGTVEF